MYSLENIIFALECTSSPEMNCIKEKCPFYEKMKESEKKSFEETHGMTLPDDFFEGCDIDKIGLLAVEKLREYQRKEESDNGNHSGN